MAMSFAIEHPDRLVDGIIEVVWTRESLVSKMMLLQIAPELFDVVELRRVFRQPLDREPGRPLASAARVALLVWIGPLSRTSTTGFVA